MPTELEQAIANLPHPLTLECFFQGYEHPETDKLFQQGIHKWLVKLSYNGQSFQTEYAQGIGTATAPREGHSYVIYTSGAVAPKDWRTNHCVDATNFRAQWYKNERSAARPKISDVLDCLLSDCSAGSESFEDFCSNFGYDTDSRKAHETWQICKNTFIALHVLFGNDLQLIEGKQH